jgi:hypothetical protein
MCRFETRRRRLRDVSSLRHMVQFFGIPPALFGLARSPVNQPLPEKGDVVVRGSSRKSELVHGSVLSRSFEVGDDLNAVDGVVAGNIGEAELVPGHGGRMVVRL